MVIMYIIYMETYKTKWFNNQVYCIVVIPICIAGVHKMN